MRPHITAAATSSHENYWGKRILSEFESRVEGVWEWKKKLMMKKEDEEEEKKEEEEEEEEETEEEKEEE
jgi:hypothetical protein